MPPLLFVIKGPLLDFSAAKFYTIESVSVGLYRTTLFLDVFKFCFHIATRG